MKFEEAWERAGIGNLVINKEERTTFQKTQDRIDKFSDLMEALHFLKINLTSGWEVRNEKAND